MFANFLSTICGSLLSVCVTALAAFAVTLIFRTSTTTNFAQGSISAFGCYVVAELLNKHGIPVWIGVFVGVAVGVLIGLFIDLVIFRNGRSVNAVGKQIITMGIVSLFFGGIPLVFGTPERIPFEPFYNFVKARTDANVTLQAFGGRISITKHALICLAITIVVLSVLFVLLKYSKWGLGVRATASNEFTAELMGIDTRVITAASWSIAGALGVLAAVMYAGGGTTISPSYMTTIQVNAFLAGILGGFSTFYGPVIGAVLIPVAASCVGFLANFGLYNISRWQMVIVYVLMLIVILIKPAGLFGKRTLKKV
ncbi:MAG: branched-chain amino acid ABC transporter permease [Oscillospiraceae bacterium]|nr:branched-chain amino acid ABC transporter permease [Oscillospiraceae bacterium]